MPGVTTAYQTGDHASRPAVLSGCILYACTDHGIVYRSDRTSWSDWLEVAPGGGGGELPLDVAPGTPHAKDDEFDGATLDAKWTNPITSTRLTDATLTDGLLYLEPSASGSAAISTTGAYGIRQSAPSGSFSVAAKIAYEKRGNDLRAGIFVAKSTSTTKANMLGVQDSVSGAADACGSAYSESADWGTYDGFVATVSGDILSARWYKIVWDAATGTLRFYFSVNGVFWSPHTSRTGMSQPDRIGIHLWSNSTSIYADQRLAVFWFRVTEP